MRSVASFVFAARRRLGLGVGDALTIADLGRGAVLDLVGLVPEGWAVFRVGRRLVAVRLDGRHALDGEGRVTTFVETWSILEARRRSVQLSGEFAHPEGFEWWHHVGGGMGGVPLEALARLSWSPERPPEAFEGAVGSS